jgi:hypothetical protein
MAQDQVVTETTRDVDSRTETCDQAHAADKVGGAVESVGEAVVFDLKVRF